MSKSNGKPAAAAAGIGKMIALKAISPCPLNPRKTFDKHELADLAVSIAASGIDIPVLVRPAKRKDHYELIDGERRYRAAQIAELAEVPAIVREMSDAEVLQHALMIDLQKVGIPDIEKADALHTLIERHGVSIDDVAGRLGRSVSTVRNLLRMRDLPKCLRQACADGTVPASTAQAVARVPGSETRERFARLVVCGSRHWHGKPPTDADVAKARKQDAEPLTFRETRSLIEQHGYRLLARASFSRTSLDLITDAGSCDACPKRAGNMRDEDPDLAKSRPDICTDVECYEAKVRAHANKIVAAHEEAGRPVLTANKAKELFASYQPSHLVSPDWVELVKVCDDDTKGRTYEQLVGKALAEEVTIAIDPAGGVHQLVPKKSAQKELRKAGITKAHPHTANGSPKRDREADAQKANRQAAALIANGRVAERIQKATSSSVFASPEMRDMLVGLATALIGSGLTSTGDDDVAKRRGWEYPDGYFRQRAKPMHDKFAGMAAGELLGVIAELVAAELSGSWQYRGINKDDGYFWTAFGVDPEQCVKEASAAATPTAGFMVGARVKRTRRISAGVETSVGTIVALQAKKGKPPHKAHVEWDVAGKKKHVEWIGVDKLELVPPTSSAMERSAERAKKAAAITADTFLADLCVSEDGAGSVELLRQAGLLTVGHLCARVDSATAVYQALREIGVLPDDVNSIGDALVDADAFDFQGKEAALA